jgi:hypothetical protein
MVGTRPRDSPSLFQAAVLARISGIVFISSGISPSLIYGSLKQLINNKPAGEAGFRVSAFYKLKRHLTTISRPVKPALLFLVKAAVGFMLQKGLERRKTRYAEQKFIIPSPVSEIISVWRKNLLTLSKRGL